MKPIVIFGAGAIAEVADFYFGRQGRIVAAFTVDSEFINSDSCFERPLIPFDKISTLYGPDQYDGFVAVSYTRMNTVRAAKTKAMRDAGYFLVSYVSQYATILTEVIGTNCLILEDNTIQPFSRIGDNVTLWSGNHIGHHSVIEDNVFISSHVVVSGGVKVGRNSFIGVNTTIVDHISIAPFTLLGAGCIVQNDTDVEGVYAPTATMEKRKVNSLRLRNF
jgi:sugar O-acyltransferase (sialic acid O-acetyltransferase NeuD family)